MISSVEISIAIKYGALLYAADSMWLSVTYLTPKNHYLFTHRLSLFCCEMVDFLSCCTRPIFSHMMVRLKMVKVYCFVSCITKFCLCLESYISCTNFFSSLDAWSCASEVLQGLFVFPDPRVVMRGHCNIY